jgi:hypothetical protein
MAWSYAARRQPPLPGCTGHKNCANCLSYATRWRAKVCDVLALPRWQQPALFEMAA